MLIKRSLFFNEIEIYQQRDEFNRLARGQWNFLSSLVRQETVDSWNLLNRHPVGLRNHYSETCQQVWDRTSSVWFREVLRSLKCDLIIRGI